MGAPLPRTPGTQGERWPRSWISYERYRVIHERNLEALIAENLVTVDTTQFFSYREAGELEGVYLQGRVETAGGGVLYVFKRLDVRIRHGRPQVLTNLYTYHARVRLEGGAVDVFRYDNTHGEVETLHQHVYDSDGNMIAKEPLPLEELPPLSRIVRDVEFYARYLAGAGA